MKVADIPREKLLLIRWKDILELHLSDDAIDDEDYERRMPVMELVGRIKTIRRGIVVVETEWSLMKDFDEYKGEGGSTQLMPIGCIDSVFELKIGKRLYQNPDYREEAKKDAGDTNKPT